LGAARAGVCELTPRGGGTGSRSFYYGKAGGRHQELRLQLLQRCGVGLGHLPRVARGRATTGWRTQDIPNARQATGQDFSDE